jgi:hypothetical protein
MSYLTVPGDFEKAINRGNLSFRSDRLKALVEAVNEYISHPSRPRLTWVQLRWDEWKQRDPKEFSDRGRPIEQQMRDEIKGRFIRLGGREIPVVDPDAHPVYQPGVWNGNRAIQLSTNCYAYACDDPYGHPFGYRPQPGEFGMYHNNTMQPTHVRYAVMQDDLHRNARQMERLIPLVRLRNDPVPDNVANAPGYYLIALITAPGMDYHWVRQDRNGMWSHKPGHTAATNLDSNNRPIYDPRDATFIIEDEITPGRVVRMKYQFTTFYYAPKGGVRTGSLGRVRGRYAQA